jgi:hypothetical protein
VQNVTRLCFGSSVDVNMKDYQDMMQAAAVHMAAQGGHRYVVYAYLYILGVHACVDVPI